MKSTLCQIHCSLNMKRKLSSMWKAVQHSTAVNAIPYSQLNRVAFLGTHTLNVSGGNLIQCN